jgi:16S rRNA (uracil1498-N3)-methyltransferase
LDGSESRHAAGPLRLRVGDSVVLADGSGHLADAVLRVVANRGCEAEIVATRLIPEPSDLSLTLAMAVLHSQAMDWAVQKAVEIGIDHLVPVMASRSQLGRRAARGRLGHWRRVARQALKQCRRPWQMEIAEPQTVDEIIASCGRRRVAVADPDGSAIGELGAAIPEMLMVGPEGGFSDDELASMDRAGWLRLRLGRYVLRADTAAVVGAAAIVAAHDAEVVAGCD